MLEKISKALSTYLFWYEQRREIYLKPPKNIRDYTNIEISLSGVNQGKAHLQVTFVTKHNAVERPNHPPTASLLD